MEGAGEGDANLQAISVCHELLQVVHVSVYLYTTRVGYTSLHAAADIEDCYQWLMDVQCLYVQHKTRILLLHPVV